MIKIPNLRWLIIGLIALATTINYIDRQAIAVVAPVISKEFNLSSQDYSWLPFWFLFAYSLMQIFSGRLIDVIGTKRGFSLSIIWWSIANMLHAFGQGVMSFSAFRFLLGVGEAGNYPAGLKAIAEWFPKKERATAVGIINAGTGLGAILAPPIVAFLVAAYNWKVAFIVTGAIGFVWFVAWQLVYAKPSEHPRITDEELELIEADRDVSEADEERRPWHYFLRYKEVWGLMFGRFVCDGAFYFFVFWLPKYLTDVRGFNISQIGYFAWIPFLAADVGAIFGGWLCGFLISRGRSVNFSRKTVMWIGALIVPVILLASSAESPMRALFLIAVGMFAIQIKSSSLFTVPADLFRSKDVAFVWGLSGAAGSFGGMLFQPLVGWLVGNYSYAPVFWIAAFMHIVSAMIVMAMIPRIVDLDAEKSYEN
ncbi:MAG: MFS transporter [Acidobacteria bacterium]|nr:MFS transporter [Acidobacteriota bacterium]